jgi:hypothetical protein
MDYPEEGSLEDRGGVRGVTRLEEGAGLERPGKAD